MLDSAGDEYQRVFGGHPPPPEPQRHEGNGHVPRLIVPRPTVELGTDEWRINNECIEALSNHNAAHDVYQRGALLVRVVRTARPGKSKVGRPQGTPRIDKMPSASLSEILTRIAEFVFVTKDQDGAEATPGHPPSRSLSAILARGNYPKVRCLEALVESPTMRADGTILSHPGWDAETGLLYEPNATFPAVSECPDRQQARAAADRLLQLVIDFPFGGETEAERRNHKSVWLSAVLTTLARFAIAGPCPLFLFDANCPGTGKSMLADLIALIATGRAMSRTAFPEKDEELRKRITSIALAGDRLMLFDNLDGAFGGASLDAALTGTTWSDRLLGKNEMAADLPLLTTWFATGNNVTLKGDVQRRVVPCRLETRDERPEERGGFRFPDLLSHVRANRPQLVVDALTILRAFVVAGRPQVSLPPFGSYEDWCAVVRQAVYWTIGADPCSTRQTIRAADPALANLTAILEGWAELPGGRTGLSVAEALRMLNDPNSRDSYETLRGALMEMSKNDRLPGPGTVGNRLRIYRHRVVNGRMLDGRQGHGGVQIWRVADTD